MTAQGRAGRASALAQHHAKIVDGFIRSVALMGLEAVTVDHITTESGCQRSAVRRFFRTRRALISAAIITLSDRRASTIAQDFTAHPDTSDLIAMIFDPARHGQLGQDERALAALIGEAAHAPELAAHARRVYDTLLTEIEHSLARAHPQATVERLRDTAWTLMCLAEHTTAMQRLGYPPTTSHAAARIAGHLLATLTTEPGRRGKPPRRAHHRIENQ